MKYFLFFIFFLSLNIIDSKNLLASSTAAKKAAMYVSRYSKEYPKNYRHIKGNDCANFISHGLKEGGILVNKGNHASLPWVNSQSLHDYLIEEKYGEELYLFDKNFKKGAIEKVALDLENKILNLGLKVGDLVFNVWEKNKKKNGIKHVVMVTAIDKDNVRDKVKVSGHSKNIKNLTLKNYLYWVADPENQKFSYIFTKINYPEK